MNYVHNLVSGCFWLMTFLIAKVIPPPGLSKAMQQYPLLSAARLVDGGREFWPR
jgi:hypothetical protein